MTSTARLCRRASLSLALATRGLGARQAQRRPSGRSALAEAAAQPLDARLGHRRRGRRPGPHLGRASRLRLVTARTEIGAGHHSDDGGRVLRAGAAGPRVRRRRATSSATGADPATGYEWPSSPGGIAVDAKGNVWIAAAGPPRDSRVRARRARPCRRAPPPRPRAGSEPLRRDGRGAGARGAAATRRDARTPRAEVLAHRRRSCCRSARPAHPAATTAPTALNRPAGVAFDAAATKSTSPTASRNHRVAVFDADDRRLSSGTGAARRSRPMRGASVKRVRDRALRRASRTTGSSTSAIAATTASRSSRRTASS